jgi:hypothetical protein
MQVVHVPRAELHDYVQSLRSTPLEVYSIHIDPEDSACYMVELRERRDIETR